jgi:hypothetical protein
MSVCTNLGPDRRSRLNAYAGYVVLRSLLRAQIAHQYALTIADPHNGCAALFHICTLALRHPDCVLCAR